MPDMVLLPLSSELAPQDVPIGDGEASTHVTCILCCQADERLKRGTAYEARDPIQHAVLFIEHALVDYKPLAGIVN